MHCSLLESPRSEVAISMSTVHYSTLPSVSLNGFLFKTGSVTRVITDRKGREGGWNQETTLRIEFVILS